MSKRVEVGEPSTVEHLRAAEYRRRAEAGESFVLLDVREPFEREMATIPLGPSTRELHVPISQVSTQLATIREAARGARLVVYCHHGVRSLEAARWLVTQGLRPVANLEGGIEAYAREADRTIPRY